VLHYVADLARATGDFAHAEALLGESLRRSHESGQVVTAQSGLVFLALLRRHQGRYDEAARLLGATAKGVVQGKLWDHARVDRDASVAAARTALGEEAFNERWSEG
jgi:hypothetical protein